MSAIDAEAFADPIRAYVSVARLRAMKLKERLTHAVEQIDYLLDELDEADTAILDGVALQ